MDPDARFEVRLRVATTDQACFYQIEHWFEDRPESETVAALFDEAKRDFATFYPEADAEDFTVEIYRLRPAEVYGPRAP